MNMKKLSTSVKSASSQKRSSHLYLQERNLKLIPKLNKTKEVLVLYLYGNSITKIEYLNGFTNLVFLYLQKNQISVIENLQQLTKLKKLYIGHNNINVLEGLTNNKQLEELHIEKQNLSDGACFCFDPRSVLTLRHTLQVLNISHNRISCLSVLSSLKNLKVIDASYNNLDDIREICEVVQNWLRLEDANFQGNPVVKRHRYREDIIAKARNLEILDGKFVSDITRNFIRRFEAERMLKGSKPSISITDEIKGLPRNYPPALKKAVSASLVRKHGSNPLDDLSTFDENDAVYIAWKALPKRRPYVKLQEPKRKIADFVKKTIFVNSLPQL